MGKADRRHSQKMNQRRSRARLKARKKRQDAVKRAHRKKGASTVETPA